MKLDREKLIRLVVGYKEHGLKPCAMQVANDYWYHCIPKSVRVDMVGGTGYNVYTMERTHKLIDELSIQIINEGVIDDVPTCTYRN